jgi:hypothetical protein
MRSSVEGAPCGSTVGFGEYTNWLGSHCDVHGLLDRAAPVDVERLARLAVVEELGIARRRHRNPRIRRERRRRRRRRDRVRRRLDHRPADVSLDHRRHVVVGARIALHDAPALTVADDHDDGCPSGCKPSPAHGARVRLSSAERQPAPRAASSRAAADQGTASTVQTRSSSLRCETGPGERADSCRRRRSVSQSCRDAVTPVR